jgi:hypothetical protein
MEGLNNIINFFPNYHHANSIKYFLKACLTDYLLFVILSLTNIIFFIRTRQLFKSLFFTISILGYWFIISISNAEVPNDFYIQSMYLPLGIMVFTPLFFEVIPQLNNKMLRLSVIMYLSIRLFFIVDASEWFTKRLAWNEKFIAHARTLENNRFIIQEDLVPMQVLGTGWSSSFETLLLSSLHHPDSAITLLIHSNPSQFNWLQRDDAYLTQWDIWYGDEIPKKYFNLKNSRYLSIENDLNGL